MPGQAVFCSVDLYMTGVREDMMEHFSALTAPQRTLLYIYIGRANGQQ